MAGIIPFGGIIFFSLMNLMLFQLVLTRYGGISSQNEFPLVIESLSAFSSAILFLSTPAMAYVPTPLSFLAPS